MIYLLVPWRKSLSVEITLVISNHDIECVADLARKIWQQHFTPIIGESQVEYMLTNFQNVNAIKTQINDGLEYYLVKVEGQHIGYLGLNHDFEQKKMMLSKIYVEYPSQKKGVGQSILNFVENRCLESGFSSVWLTVNKFNDNTIAWYKRRGFVIIDKVKKDIGDGFFMDDYFMEKMISTDI